MNYFLFTSKAEPALNLTALRAGILMAFFVFGLIPVRAAFCVTENVPKPNSATFSPFSFALGLPQ